MHITDQIENLIKHAPCTLLTLGGLVKGEKKSITLPVKNTSARNMNIVLFTYL